MLEFLLKNSGVAKMLEPPLALSDILGSYCESTEKFAYVVDLLEKLPQFAREKLKLSNCVIRDELPYDSLIGLTKDDLSELWAVMDYLDFPKSLMMKLEPVIENMTLYEKYIICGYERFDSKHTSHWSYIGDLEGLKYAYEQGYYRDEESCLFVAIENGHLECIKWLHNQGCPWTAAASHATQNGHLECLKYLHENGCPWDELTCACAAANGQLECLKYLHEQGCPWNKSTCANAALRGHLDCLKYAHDPPVGDSCPWDKWTCTYAAMSGHLDCLKYAHDPPVGDSCPWDELTCAYAAQNGHSECLAYARNHNCPE